MQGWIDDQVRVTEERWVKDLVKKLVQMKWDPHEAWKAIYTLAEGTSARKNPKTFAFRKEDGTIATSDAENMEILEKHFAKVFNNHRPVNFDILNEVLQRETLWNEDRNITYPEFEEALNSLANDKAPGENGISPNLLKALDAENRLALYQLIVDFWEGTDYESWHSGLLSIIPKRGRDKSDPNNYRGINLMDVASKVMSRIINGRLFKILDAHCTKFQFGGTPATYQKKPRFGYSRCVR
ncbi:hypothetical protein ACHAWF_015837 [Thalassiosira exigua]